MAELYDLAGRPIADTWLPLADDQPLPAGTHDILVSLSRWQAEPERLRSYSGRLGLALANTDDVDACADDLARFALIALSFPAFSDGRAFSQAATLSGRLGYTGILRATGDIQPDQAFYLRRCGFTQLEFATQPATDLERLLHPFSRSYQPAPGDAQGLELSA